MPDWHSRRNQVTALVVATLICGAGMYVYFDVLKPGNAVPATVPVSFSNYSLKNSGLIVQLAPNTNNSTSNYLLQHPADIAVVVLNYGGSQAILSSTGVSSIKRLAAELERNGITVLGYFGSGYQGNGSAALYAAIGLNGVFFNTPSPAAENYVKQAGGFVLQTAGFQNGGAVTKGADMYSYSFDGESLAQIAGNITRVHNISDSVADFNYVSPEYIQSATNAAHSTGFKIYGMSDGPSAITTSYLINEIVSYATDFQTALLLPHSWAVSTGASGHYYSNGSEYFVNTLENQTTGEISQSLYGYNTTYGFLDFEYLNFTADIPVYNSTSFYTVSASLYSGSGILYLSDLASVFPMVFEGNFHLYLILARFSLTSHSLVNMSVENIENGTTHTGFYNSWSFPFMQQNGTSLYFSNSETETNLSLFNSNSTLNVYFFGVNVTSGSVVWNKTFFYRNLTGDTVNAGVGYFIMSVFSSSPNTSSEHYVNSTVLSQSNGNTMAILSGYSKRIPSAQHNVLYATSAVNNTTAVYRLNLSDGSRTELFANPAFGSGNLSLLANVFIINNAMTYRAFSMNGKSLWNATLPYISGSQDLLYEIPPSQVEPGVVALWSEFSGFSVAVLHMEQSFSFLSLRNGTSLGSFSLEINVNIVYNNGIPEGLSIDQPSFYSYLGAHNGYIMYTFGSHVFCYRILP